MSSNSELPEDIRAAKYEVLDDAQKRIAELIRTTKNSPTTIKALNSAQSEIRKLSKLYRSQADIAADNAAYKAARDGGSSRGPAFASADMKPSNL